MKLLSRPFAFGFMALLNSWPMTMSFQHQRSLAVHPKDRLQTRDCIELHQSSQGGDEDTSAKVRFSGLELDKQSASSTSATASNPLDAFIAFISSDVASIALGLIGLCLLLVERLSLQDAATLGSDQYQYAEKLGEETRSNLIAVIASGSVLLNGISKLDVTSALAEAVELEGIALSEPTSFFNEGDPFQKEEETLQWGMQSILRATPAKSVVLLQTSTADSKKWEVMSMLGVMPLAETRQRPEIGASTPILDRFLKEDFRGETYLPTLQALPGKAEFTYIPDNAQEVLILSVPTTASTTTALLLGSNRAKSFTPRDVAWCQTIAARLGTLASQHTEVCDSPYGKVGKKK